MDKIGNYDFSGKRVRLNGKCLDKFSVANEIDDIDPFRCSVISMDVFSYSELASMLKDLLSSRVLH